MGASNVQPFSLSLLAVKKKILKTAVKNPLN
jgi:hypothetical protein